MQFKWLHNFTCILNIWLKYVYCGKETDEAEVEGNMDIAWTVRMTDVHKQPYSSFHNNLKFL